MARPVMRIRQVRWWIDGFTGLVVASVGVALAGLTWRLAGNTGQAPVAAVVASASGQPVDVGGLLALAPFGTVAVASDAASDGSLHLKGILLAVPASASTALIAGADGKVASYGVGAALGGGVVEAIAADQIILRTAHGLQSFGFSPAVQGPSAARLGVNSAAAGFLPAGAAPGSGAGPPPPPPPSQMTGAAGMPAEAGLRVGSSAPAALLAAGLQPGDIVEQVNGVPVTAGMGAEMMARDLGSGALRGGNAQAVVLRHGTRLSLRLAIH